MGRGLFVVGTDTGVGKTVFAAALVAALRGRGLKAGYMKPVASEGLPCEGRLVSPDALFVARIAGLRDPWDLINPVCFPGALSPLAAAQAAGQEVDLAPVGPALAALAQGHDLVVVEGVGGLLAPLSPEHLGADLVARLGLPALVVGRPGLGTINHTLLTLEALQHRDLEVWGFCYSGVRPGSGDPSFLTNARHTALFTRVPFLGTLPWVPDLDDPQALAAAGAALTELLDRFVL